MNLAYHVPRAFKVTNEYVQQLPRGRIIDNKKHYYPAARLQERLNKVEEWQKEESIKPVDEQRETRRTTKRQ